MITSFLAILWDVDPEMVSVGPFSLRWYGLLFASGFYLGYLIMRKFFLQEGRSEEELDRLFLYVLLGTVIGARLGHVLFYEPRYYFAHPDEIYKVWHGGLASHGGAIGILIAVYLYSRKYGQGTFLWVLDRLGIVVALGGAFIRIGNLMNSEILGTPAPTLPWAFVFQRVDTIPRHPVQLYESLFYFLTFWILYFLYQKKQSATPQGLLFGLFLLLVFGFRFLVEFVKEPQSEFGLPYGLRMGQLLSIPFILIGVWLVWRVKIKQRLLED